MASDDPTILIVNDDGIRARGLECAARALSGLGRIVLVAPLVQKSGVGRSVSLFEPIRVSRTTIDEYEAYAVAGTPTDAVLLAEYAILHKKADVIVSGINVGENLSTESVMTSGTIGAALTGASQGIPSMAISLQAHHADVFEPQSEIDFSVAADVTLAMVSHILQHGMPPHVDVLNVNVPMGILQPKYQVTQLSRNVFDIRIIERLDPRGNAYFWIGSDFKQSGTPGTDMSALNSGHISVTPLTLDNTARASEMDMSTWFRPLPRV
ncbi:MAG: 5'/3'-nucleotidase SurE [Halobacteriota archaeon]